MEVSLLVGIVTQKLVSGEEVRDVKVTSLYVSMKSSSGATKPNRLGQFPSE